MTRRLNSSRTTTTSRYHNSYHCSLSSAVATATKSDARTKACIDLNCVTYSMGRLELSWLAETPIHYLWTIVII